MCVFVGALVVCRGDFRRDSSLNNNPKIHQRRPGLHSPSPVLLQQSSTRSRYLQPFSSQCLLHNVANAILPQNISDHITALFKTFLRSSSALRPRPVAGSDTWRPCPPQRLLADLAPLHQHRFPSRAKQVSVPQKYRVLCCLGFSPNNVSSSQKRPLQSLFSFMSQLTGHISREIPDHSPIKPGQGVLLLGSHITLHSANSEDTVLFCHVTFDTASVMACASAVPDTQQVLGYYFK